MFTINFHWTIQVLCVTSYYTSRLSFAIVHSSELLQKSELSYALIFWRHIHISYLFPMFAEAIHVKDIEPSNLQVKNQSWVMLSNGGYIHKELANTQGEHLFPQIVFTISCHVLLQIKFHANDHGCLLIAWPRQVTFYSYRLFLDKHFCYYLLE